MHVNSECDSFTVLLFATVFDLTVFTRVVISNVMSTARQVRDCVQWIFSEPMLVYYIQLFRDGYWPNGQLSAASEAPTESQKLELRRQAKLALLRNIPG